MRRADVRYGDHLRDLRDAMCLAVLAVIHWWGKR
jgi:hypothetical protein